MFQFKKVIIKTKILFLRVNLGDLKGCNERKINLPIKVYVVNSAIGSWLFWPKNYCELIRPTML